MQKLEQLAFLVHNSGNVRLIQNICQLILMALTRAAIALYITLDKAIARTL